MKSQSFVQYLEIPSWFDFDSRTTTKIDQSATNSFREGRRLDYEDSPIWITQFGVRMRKIWCLEDEKIGEKISVQYFKFFSWIWISETNGILKRIWGKTKECGTHLGGPLLAVPVEARGHHGKPPKWGLISLVLLLTYP